MKNINASSHGSSILKPLVFAAALAAMIPACRNRLLNRIDTTVRGLEVNCASLMYSLNKITVTSGDSSVGIDDGRASCECHEDQGNIECEFSEPDRLHGKVDNTIFYKAEAAKNGGYVHTAQRVQYKSSSAQIGTATSQGMPICVSDLSGSVQVGITADACVQEGKSTVGRLEKIMQSLRTYGDSEK